MHSVRGVFVPSFRLISLFLDRHRLAVPATRLRLCPLSCRQPTRLPDGIAVFLLGSMVFCWNPGIHHCLVRDGKSFRLWVA